MIPISDMVAQLTRAHHNAEPYTHEANGTSYTQRHIVAAPALIDQLSQNTPTSAGTSCAPGGGGYESKPAAFIEATDTLALIDHEAARWVRTLGHDDPGTTKTCVRFLGSLLPPLTACSTPAAHGERCCHRHDIERDIRRWWTQARIMSGWDTPAWKPSNTCPLCGHRGGLRIHAADLTALCVECRATWTTDTVSLLAEHIRAENHDEPIAQGA